MENRIKNVDFLRFIFAVMIVMYHIRNYNALHVSNFGLAGIDNWCICVDFFFIISGFFLFKNFNIATDTFDFAKKRFLRLAPLVWLVILLFAIINLFVNVNYTFDGNILRLFLLNCIGVTRSVEIGGEKLGVTWFVSVLFWVSLFYFYLAKILEKKYLNLTIWIIIFFSYCMYLNRSNFVFGSISANIYSVFNKGMLRGFAGIGVGYFLSMFYNSGFLKTVTKFEKIVISVVEIILAYYLFYNLMFNPHIIGSTHITYILLFIILFYLFLTKNGIISKLLDNNFSELLGSWSYAIFVMHIFILAIFRRIIYVKNILFVENNLFIFFICYIISAILFGIIVHYIFEKPINKLIKNKLPHHPSTGKI